MITYKETKDFNETDLKNLFLSVNWSSGNYPDKLVIAMKNSDTVMTVYFHYLLVMPDYHSQGIGKSLLTKMLEIYKEYARKAVIAYNKEIGFYQRCGFEPHSDKTPMFITFLTT